MMGQSLHKKLDRSLRGKEKEKLSGREKVDFQRVIP